MFGGNTQINTTEVLYSCSCASFVFKRVYSRCPKEVYPHVPTVISICLRYLTYDPNYNFDDEDEDDNAMDAEQNDEDYQGTITHQQVNVSQ